MNKRTFLKSLGVSAIGLSAAPLLFANPPKETTPIPGDYTLLMIYTKKYDYDKRIYTNEIHHSHFLLTIRPHVKDSITLTHPYLRAKP